MMSEKARQLRKYKAIATGLFLLMAGIFIFSTLYQKSHQDTLWVGYLKAFAEAAMVGALADWFAVEALFHHPLGLKIPHTNLIENSKKKIGDNLGDFVVENFLSPKTLRPYIHQLHLSKMLGQWLTKEVHQQQVINQISDIGLRVLHQLDQAMVLNFLSTKAEAILAQVQVHKLLGQGIDYMVDKGEHQRLVSYLAGQIQDYIIDHQDVVRERVKRESYTLIPSFIDDAIADKITKGIAQYFQEIKTQPEHLIRTEITQKIKGFSKELGISSRWAEDLDQLKQGLLSKPRLQLYIQELWLSIQNNLAQELSAPNSKLKGYLKRYLSQMAQQLNQDPRLQSRIDSWARHMLYKTLLRNTHRFSTLISETVGNWQGKELSQKLELEVGKDLQFIRLNGTLVGGFVGLVIYTIAHFFL